MHSTRTPSLDISQDAKGVQILARSLFRDMREQGYSKEQIIGLSTQLIALVNEDMQRVIAAE
ncbi:MAG: hypothetical protein AB1Z98_36030 [Nannocystaceae bacterium]